MSNTNSWALPEEIDMTELSLRRLEYFLVVAEEGSVTGAARRLHMAQPPLSQQVRKLEEELGCTLFVRSSQGLRLTPAGVALVRGASSLLGEAGRVRARVLAADQGDTGFLAVGCVPVACAAVAPPLLARFREEAPQVRVHVRELDTMSLYNALVARVVDVGLVRTGVDVPGVRTAPFLEERPLIALPEAHRLARQEELELADLAAEDFVLFSRKLGTRHFDEFVSACREVGGFVPQVVSECDTVTAQLAMIGAGAGVGFVTELSGRSAAPGVAFRPVRDLDMRLPLLLAWQGQHEDPVRARFLAVAARWAAEEAGPPAAAPSSLRPGDSIGPS